MLGRLGKGQRVADGKHHQNRRHHDKRDHDRSVDAVQKIGNFRRHFRSAFGKDLLDLRDHLCRQSAGFPERRCQHDENNGSDHRQYAHKNTGDSHENDIGSSALGRTCIQRIARGVHLPRHDCGDDRADRGNRIADQTADHRQARIVDQVIDDSHQVDDGDDRDHDRDDQERGGVKLLGDDPLCPAAQLRMALCMFVALIKEPGQRLRARYRSHIDILHTTLLFYNRNLLQLYNSGRTLSTG